MKASAKTGEGVDEIFEKLTAAIFNQKKPKEDRTTIQIPINRPPCK
jgi:hypothetical protein